MLGLLPGVGQFYNRQFPLGMLFFSMWLACLLLAIPTVLTWWSNAFLFAALVLMNVSANQALVAAQRINGVILFDRRRVYGGIFLFMFLWAVGFALLQWLALGWLTLLTFATLTALALTHGEGARHPVTGRKRGPHPLWVPAGFVAACVVMFAVLPQAFFRSVVSLRSIGQPFYAPLIHKGDRVLFESPMLSFDGPQLGDIVLYDPPRFTMEHGENLFLVNMPLGMERVVGLPGDRIERRRGVWYRNGELAPPQHQPLVQDQLWDDLELEVPDGHYGVLITYGPEEWMVLGTFRAPRLRDAIVVGWKEASVVPASVIYGRAVAVYHPPAHRKWLTRGAFEAQQ
jgi:signal peptidase I